MSETTNDALLKQVRPQLKGKLATARVTGWRTATENPALSEQRATAVRTHIVRDLLKNDRDETTGMGSNAGAAPAWSHDGGIRDKPGVTVLIERPK